MHHGLDRLGDEGLEIIFPSQHEPGLPNGLQEFKNKLGRHYFYGKPVVGIDSMQRVRSYQWNLNFSICNDVQNLSELHEIKAPKLFQDVVDLCWGVESNNKETIPVCPAYVDKFWRRLTESGTAHAYPLIFRWATTPEAPYRIPRRLYCAL